MMHSLWWIVVLSLYSSKLILRRLVLIYFVLCTHACYNIITCIVCYSSPFQLRISTCLSSDWISFALSVLMSTILFWIYLLEQFSIHLLLVVSIPLPLAPSALPMRVWTYPMWRPWENSHMSSDTFTTSLVLFSLSWHRSLLMESEWYHYY